jgi:hypothetical protein
MGKPTASRFEEIITPGGEPSKSWEGYMWEILAEMMVGHPIETKKTSYMVRGTDEEDAAVSAFELLYDLETERAGFVTNNDQTIGASPDRLAGDKALVQIKVLAPHNHVKLLATGTPEKSYKPQIQGELYVAEREITHLVYYNPEMPLIVVPVERDNGFITKLETALEEFVAKLAARRAMLEEKYGSFPTFAEEAEPDHSADHLSDADVDLIVADRFGKPAHVKAVDSYCARVGTVAFAGILLKHNVTTAEGITEENWRALCVDLETELKRQKEEKNG